MKRSGVLLVIGSNPPSQTSGNCTLARAEQARAALGYDGVALHNIFTLATYRTGGLVDEGRTHEGWAAARAALIRPLDSASAVLLAYGVQEPSGVARQHFRDQVPWLDAEISRRCLPTWWVGGAPRHPSRWQRHTWRHHPGLAYADALGRCLLLKSDD